MGFSFFLYKLIKSIFEKLGYKIAIGKKNIKPKPYEQIFTNAAYAPWEIDTAFNNFYGVIKKNTMVDKYRCYELWNLVSQTSKLKGVLIEVGSWKGGTGSIIAKKASLEHIKDKIYLCDTFVGVVKAGKNDSGYVGGEHSETSYDLVTNLINKLKLENVIILKGIFPDETSDKIVESSIRFCHIDVDVYQSAKDVFFWVWERLVVGGIIVFDDYGFQGCEGVTKFVNEEISNSNNLIIYNLNGHAIVIKLKK